MPVHGARIDERAESEPDDAKAEQAVHFRVAIDRSEASPYGRVPSCEEYAALGQTDGMNLA